MNSIGPFLPNQEDHSGYPHDEEEGDKEVEAKVIIKRWLCIIVWTVVLFTAAFVGYKFWEFFPGRNSTSSWQQIYNEQHADEQAFHSPIFGTARIMLLQKEPLPDGWHQANAEEMKKIFETNTPKKSYGCIVLSSTLEPRELSLPKFIGVRYVNSFAVEIESFSKLKVERDPERFLILAVKDEPRDSELQLTSR